MFEAALSFTDNPGKMYIKRPSMFSVVQEVAEKISEYAENGITFNKVVIQEVEESSNGNTTSVE